MTAAFHPKPRLCAYVRALVGLLIALARFLFPSECRFSRGTCLISFLPPPLLGVDPHRPLQDRQAAFRQGGRTFDLFCFFLRERMSLARVDYIPPWWTYWLHNFPHINLRFQPVDKSFQPEDDNYQQVSGGEEQQKWGIRCLQELSELKSSNSLHLFTSSMLLYYHMHLLYYVLLPSFKPLFKRIFKPAFHYWCLFKATFLSLREEPTSIELWKHYLNFKILIILFHFFVFRVRKHNQKGYFFFK